MRLGGPVVLLVLALDLVGLALGGGVVGVVGGLALVAALAPRPKLSDRGVLPFHVAALVALVGFALADLPQEGLGVLVGWLLVHRLWTGAGRNDARLALLFGALLLLLGCLRTETIWMAPVLAAQAFLLPAALLRIEVGEVLPLGARSVLTGGAVAVLSAGLFVLLPRLNGGYLATGGGAGAGNEVMLGDDQDNARDDQAIVLHVRVTDKAGLPVSGPFYVRGRGLDHFDGTRWTATLPAGRAPSPAGSDAQADVELEPALGNVAFAPFEALAIEGIGQLLHDGDGTFFHHQGARGTRYLARIRRGPGAPPALDGRAVQALSQLPDLDPRIVPLARSIDPSETDPVALASAIERHLSTEYTYLADPPTPTGDPLGEFLFERRTGHCEYFASALAVLLRVRGVPARLGTGYWSGELDETGERVVVRAAHAHAWVEVPTDTGWRVFDASPVDGLPLVNPPGVTAWLSRVQDSWSRWIVAYDLGDQSSGLESIGERGRPAPQWAAGTGLVVTMGVLGAGYFLAAMAQVVSGLVVLRDGRAPRDPLAKVAARARRSLRRLGVSAPDVPLGMLVERVDPRAREALAAVADAVYAGRYGGADPVAARRRAVLAERELARVVKAVRAERQ